MEEYFCCISSQPEEKLRRVLLRQVDQAINYDDKYIPMAMEHRSNIFVNQLLVINSAIGTAVLDAIM